MIKNFPITFLSVFLLLFTVSVSAQDAARTEVIINKNQKKKEKREPQREVKKQKTLVTTSELGSPFPEAVLIYTPFENNTKEAKIVWTVEGIDDFQMKSYCSAELQKSSIISSVNSEYFDEKAWFTLYVKPGTSEDQLISLFANMGITNKKLRDASQTIKK